MIDKDFLTYFKSKNYSIVDNQPILNDDPSLLFVNSSIAVFKEGLKDGLKITPTANVQDCFRANFKSPWLFYFKMLGLVSSLKLGSSVFSDIIDFLRNKLINSTIKIIVNNDDDDLISIAANVLGPENVITISKCQGYFSTRWKYGESYPILGRGVTFAVLCDSSDPSAKIGVNYYIPLGNYIVVENYLNQAKYVEVGIGLELLESTINDTIIYDIEYLSNYNQKAKQLQTSPFNYVKHVSAIEFLISQGVSLGHKSHGYILKKIIRSFVDCLVQEHGIETGFSLAKRISKSHPLFNNSTIQYIRHIENIKQKGHKMNFKNFDLEKLKSTYGVNEVYLEFIK